MVIAQASLQAGDLSFGLVPLHVIHAADERGITSLTSSSSGGWQEHFNTQFMTHVDGDVSLLATQGDPRKTNAYFP